MIIRQPKYLRVFEIVPPSPVGVCRIDWALTNRREQMCSCHSYNWEIGTEKEVILNMANFFPETIGAKQAVCIDSCIAGTIAALWKAGVYTLGSCCGHNRDKPSIVLNREDAEQARRVLVEVDSREFNLKAWVLTSV